MEYKKAAETFASILAGAFIGTQLQLLADSGQVMYGRLLVKLLVGIISFAASYVLLQRTADSWFSLKRPIVVGFVGSIVFLSLASVFDGLLDQTAGTASDLISFWIGALIVRILVLLPFTFIGFLLLFVSLRFLYTVLLRFLRFS